ncbi:TPA: hypothetical protein MFM56_001814 [Klebsiella pneumoniae]|nr:hypothetical protein [Klebsiella pneumoniae]
MKRVKQRWICFYVAAVFRPEPGCVCSTGISACRKMTSGGSGTGEYRPISAES